MEKSIFLSDHALMRLAQRNLHQSEIEYVLKYGRRIYNGGVLHVFFGSKDIPGKDLRNKRAHQLVGTTILVNSKTKDVVVTAYRNRNGLKDIRKKAPYCIPTVR